ncbi:ATP synthase subunit I [Algiphilus sp.]
MSLTRWGQWPIPVRLVTVQLGLGMVIAVGWMLARGIEDGVAALIGAAIAAAGNGFFALRLFLRPAQEPGGMLRSFMAAEVLKIALVVALLAMAMTALPGRVVPVITSFFVLQLAHLWALLWSESNRKTDQGA